LVENLGTGFGFLTFESEESVDRCCSEHYVNINGKQVLNNKQTKKNTLPSVREKKGMLYHHVRFGLQLYNQGSPLRQLETIR